MSEKFRAWFILEISMYSFPVLLGAAVTWLTLTNEAPWHVQFFQVTFIISCVLSLKAVWEMMQFAFNDKCIKNPKITLTSILFWFVIWVGVGIFAISSIGVGLAFIVPILVVLHLGYLTRKGFKFSTY